MGNKCLKGRRILFFSWPFYQYPSAIEKTLKSLGADVTTYLSAPTDNFLEVRFLEKFEQLKGRYFQKVLDEVTGKEFDYIFIINAAIFPEYFLHNLADKFNNACKILYSWDSISVYPNALRLHKYFDYIYSFDFEDTKKYKYMRFLPLFYCDDLYNGLLTSKFEYDFSFIGFGHTERYKFIKKIEKRANEEGWKYCFKLYLPSILHYIRGKYIKGLFPNAKKNDFVYSPISLNNIQQITEQSKIVVDIELSNQSGLTMRTIETLGMRKKLITTNANIKNYDFYDECNILIVERDNPQIDVSFVVSNYKTLPEEIYEKYSLSHWLKVIFQVIS